MATLTVWKFDTPTGADDAEAKLEQLQKQELVKVLDAAIVSWPEGKKSPQTHQLHGLKGAGALGGAFWGLLFGLLFFVPLLGAAVGALTGAFAGSMTDVGIDDEFISSLRSEIQPGTSALFLLSADAVLEKVTDSFGAGDAELIHSNLSPEQEERLREVFAAA